MPGAQSTPGILSKAGSRNPVAAGITCRNCAVDQTASTTPAADERPVAAAQRTTFHSHDPAHLRHHYESPGGTERLARPRAAGRVLFNEEEQP